MLLFLIPLVIIALLSLPLIGVYKGIVTGKKSKYAVIFNLCSFAAVCLLGIVLPLSGLVSAAEPVAAAEAAASSAGLGYLAASISIGLSCIGAGIAVASAAPAAIGACSEDPKSFGKAIIFVALGESVALYGLLIAIMILSRL